MQDKYLKILISIFVVLLIIAVYPYVVSEYGGVIFNKQLESRLLEETLDIGSVSLVEIKHGDTSIEIKHHDDGWKVDNYKANEEKLKSFISDFNTLSLGPIVSKNAKNHKNFGVDEENGYFLTVRNKETFSLVLGNYAPGIDKYYIRKVDSEVVYEVSGTLRSTVSGTFTDWMDKNFLQIDKNSVAKIELLGNQNFVFNKKQDGSWTTTKNRRETNVDSEQISTALDKFSNLSALTILSGQGYDDFMSNKNKVTLKFENDNKNIILNLLVVETGVSYLVKPSDENVMVVYEVSTETMDALFGFTK